MLKIISINSIKVKKLKPINKPSIPPIFETKSNNCIFGLCDHLINYKIVNIYLLE